LAGLRKTGTTMGGFAARPVLRIHPETETHPVERVHPKF
jgi:hypothetical protein